MPAAFFITNKTQPADAKLTAILGRLGATKDVDAARAIAHEFLDNCAMPKSIEAKKRELDGMTSHTKILNLCYNTMLSGEGLAVAK